jgi:hypothetical protein
VVAMLTTGHGASSGVFTAKCKVATVGFIDPIVSAGRPSAHEHTLFGPTTINPDSTYATMIASPTTCKVTVGTTFTDTAAYWQPTLFRPDGTRVPVDGQTFYYRDWPGTSQDQDVTAFPPDLKMVSGFPAPSNHTSISDGPFAKGPNWGFQCDNKQPLVDTPRDCPGGKLIMVINFPSCWDGVHTDSADHRSHMAYPTSGSCPAGFVKVPFLYQKVSFAISNCGTIGCYLSSDATMGVPSLHADFWNTWDQTTLENLVRTVLNG